jgi:hypothetical protein
VSPIEIDCLSSGSGWLRELRGCYASQNAKLEEARMRLRRGIACALLLIAFEFCAWAEDEQHDRGRAAAVPAQTHPRVLTGKERLGPKWTDEQRLDNCNVPVEKRGIKSRPSACANNSSS